MDCLHPISISNPDVYDKEHPRIFVPCGRCESCIVSFANEWRVRLTIENENSSSSFFITLTYNDTNLPLQKCSDSFGDSIVVPVVSKRDIQLFLKRFRKLISPEKIRYFLVSEYGPSTFRPHYHFLLFGLSRQYKDDIKESIRIEKLVTQSWNNGNVIVDKVTSGRIAYVTKYLSCTTNLPEYLPKPFRLMSRRPGLGSVYLEKSSLVDWHRINLANYYPSGNFKHRLPRYLKDKIFDDEMKHEIKESVDIYRKSQYDEDIIISKELGYKDYLSFREDSRKRLLRNFERKYKKSRKDV